MKCVYCGEIATTKDHIPPQGLFQKPLPANMITVPSCKKCNESFSKDDQYFITMLSLRNEIKDNPAIIANRQKILRSFTRVEALGFLETIRSGIHNRNIRTPAGILIPNQKAMFYDEERINNVINRILKGLTIFIMKDEQKKSIGIIPLHKLPYMDLRTSNFVFNKLLSVFIDRAKYTIGNGDVFSYQVVSPKDDIKSYMWKLIFFNKIEFIGILVQET